MFFFFCRDDWDVEETFSRHKYLNFQQIYKFICVYVYLYISLNIFSSGNKEWWTAPLQGV